MRLRFVFAVAFALFLGALFWPKQKSADPSSAGAQKQELSSQSAVESGQGKAPKLQSSKPGLEQPTEPVLEKIRSLKVPELEAVREEIKNSPHAPSFQLISFGEELFNIQASIENPAQAESFMEFLSNCALSNSQTSDSVKAICLRNAKKTSDRFPEFQQKNQMALDNSTPKAREIATVLNRL